MMEGGEGERGQMHDKGREAVSKIKRNSSKTNFINQEKFI